MDPGATCPAPGMHRRLLPDHAPEIPRPQRPSRVPRALELIQQLVLLPVITRLHTNKGCAAPHSRFLRSLSLPSIFFIFQPEADHHGLPDKGASSCEAPRAALRQIDVLAKFTMAQGTLLKKTRETMSIWNDHHTQNSRSRSLMPQRPLPEATDAARPDALP